MHVQDLRFSNITTHYDRLYALDDFAAEQSAQRSGVAEPQIARGVQEAAEQLRDLRASMETLASKMLMLVETELRDPSPITLPPPTRMKHFSMEEVRCCREAAPVKQRAASCHEGDACGQGAPDSRPCLASCGADPPDCASRAVHRQY